MPGATCPTLRWFALLLLMLGVLTIVFGESLSAQEHIESAAIYTADAKILAVYRRAGAAREIIPHEPPADGARFGSGFLEASTPIVWWTTSVPTWAHWCRWTTCAA